MFGKNRVFKSGGREISNVWIQIIIFVIFFVLVWFAFDSVSDASAEQDTKTLESALTKASVHCYANEGAYPVSLEYIEEEYGVQIDYDKYIVHYDAFASNLMPDITVIRK